jgi:putative ABC transport system substrate-binding protein
LQFAVLTLAAPWPVLAQLQRIYRLGWLASGTEASAKPVVDAFLHGMRVLGYAGGRNLELHMRYAGGDSGRYPGLADELIALKPDLLLGVGFPCRVMMKRTSTIPIVTIASSDPVAEGLVKSLARPGTNVTGISNQTMQLVSKQVELVAEIFPKQSRVAFLADRSDPALRAAYLRFASEAARAKGLALLVIDVVANPEGIRSAFAEIVKQRGESVVIGPTGPINSVRHAIAAEAARLRLPAVYGISGYVEVGGLLSYGANLLESVRLEVPPIVDRILKGGNPAEIPVQQSSKFELAINLKTARAMGLTIPQAVLLRADRVIE